MSDRIELGLTSWYKFIGRVLGVLIVFYTFKSIFEVFTRDILNGFIVLGATFIFLYVPVFLLLRNYFSHYPVKIILTDDYFICERLFLSNLEISYSDISEVQKIEDLPFFQTSKYVLKFDNKTLNFSSESFSSYTNDLKKFMIELQKRVQKAKPESLK